MADYSMEDPRLGHFPLEEGESILAIFQPDLNSHSSYESSVLVLTNRRLRHRLPTSGWSEIRIEEGLELERAEYGGIGELRASKAGQSVAAWTHTLAQARAASDLFDAFTALRAPASSRSPRRSIPEVDEWAPSSSFKGSPLLRLLGLARPHLGAVSLGLGLTFLSTAAGLIPPYLTMPLVDRVLVPGAQGHLRAQLDHAYTDVAFYLGALAAAAVLAWLLAWAQGAVLAAVTERMAADLRNRSFAHLQRLGLQYFGGKRTGDLVARISSDTDHLCAFLSDTLIDFITDVLMIVSTSAVLLTLDPLLAFAAVASFPLIAWLIVHIRGTLTHGFLRGGRAWSAMTSILADAIPGIRVVKAFSQEQREIARFERANQRIVDVNNRINRLWTFFWPLVQLLNQMGLLVVWAVGAWQVLHGRVTVGVLTAFIAYISRFYTRVESMSRMLTATEKASAGAQRLFEILDRAPTELEPKHPVSQPEIRGEVAFEHVSFRHGSRLVLDDVSFRVEPGRMVGIVGHTGSGKSTVANLVCRFYDVSSGAVLVDGVDVRRLSVEEHRRHIGIVLQEPFLFFGTLGENVAYGVPGASPERIIHAARAARAHDFVLKLVEGYDALVGERGQSLSGGERQRIAIARAILIDPRILILDEATSAVDVRTERQIQRALDAVVAGRTTIAIAHRLSTLRKADFIVVLRDGEVVEQGPPGELLARDGEYSRLWRAQHAATSDVQGTPATDDEDDELDAPEAPAFDLNGLRLEMDRDALVAIQADGTRTRVTPRRCFPLTNPDHFVSLVDERGHERACLDHLETIDAGSASAVVAALRAGTFLPIIRRIETVSPLDARWEWHVETDRGRVSFVVEQEEHVRALDDGRYLVTDAHGMRYMIETPGQLDTASRRLLGRFS
jgi:ATP-binding cassette, subfamily B, bacterial